MEGAFQRKASEKTAGTWGTDGRAVSREGSQGPVCELPGTSRPYTMPVNVEVTPRQPQFLRHLAQTLQIPPLSMVSSALSQFSQFPHTPRTPALPPALAATHAHPRPLAPVPQPLHLHLAAICPPAAPSMDARSRRASPAS